MGNPFKAIFRDSSGVERLEGAIDFTDQGNQPGGPWGEAGTAKFAGSGSPVGVVTPTGKGDLYVDNTTPALWQATGATSNDWALAGGGSQTAFVIAPVDLVSAFSDEVASSPPNGAATVDDTAVADGMRVLLTAQTVGTDDGIWIANTSGDWTRAADFALGAVIPGGTLIPVANAGTFLTNGFWQVTNVPSLTVGDDLTAALSLTFTKTSLQATPVELAYPGVNVGSFGGQLGFFGASVASQPVVPLTLPTLQNVIDALVAIGLVAQHD